MVWGPDLIYSEVHAYAKCNLQHPMYCACSPARIIPAKGAGARPAISTTRIPRKAMPSFQIWLIYIVWFPDPSHWGAWNEATVAGESPNNLEGSPLSVVPWARLVGESSESARQWDTVPLSTLKCRPTSWVGLLSCLPPWNDISR